MFEKFRLDSKDDSKGFIFIGGFAHISHYWYQSITADVYPI